MLFPIFVRQRKSETRYKVGYVNEAGCTAIEPVFDEGTRFYEGLASVKQKGRWGVINVEGDFVIPPKLANWCIFQDGFAGVADKRGKWGLIDKSGDFVMSPRYEWIQPFAFGLAHVLKGHSEDARCGFIDTSGTEVIPCVYHEARSFHDGLVAVQVARLWGYVDTNGLMRIKPQFGPIEGRRRFSDTYAGDFSGNVAPVWVGGSYRFIDKLGNFAFDGRFEEANSFRDGLALVKHESRFGYIDQSGNVSIDFIFSAAEDFSEGLARVEIQAHDKEQIGFIDRSGNLAIQQLFETAEAFQNGLSLVSDDEFIGYINQSGEFVWKVPYVDYGVLL